MIAQGDYLNQKQDRLAIAHEKHSRGARMDQTTRWSTLSGLAHRVAMRKAPIFAGYPEYDVEDLVTEALHAMMQAMPHHDPERSKLTTWLYLVASRRLIDLWRKRSSMWAREEKSAKLPFEPAPPPDDSTIDLADWCRSKRRLCDRMYQGHKTRLALRVLPTAEVAVIALLTMATGLTGGAVTVLLDLRPDLLEALGMEKHPGRSVCRAIWKRVQQKINQSDTAEMEAIAFNRQETP